MAYEPLSPRCWFSKGVGRDQKGMVTGPGLSRNYDCRTEGPKGCSTNSYVVLVKLEKPWEVFKLQ